MLSCRHECPQKLLSLLLLSYVINTAITTRLKFKKKHQKNNFYHREASQQFWQDQPLKVCVALYKCIWAFRMHRNHDLSWSYRVPSRRCPLPPVFNVGSLTIARNILSATCISWGCTSFKCSTNFMRGQLLQDTQSFSVFCEKVGSKVCESYTVLVLSVMYVCSYVCTFSMVWGYILHAFSHFSPLFSLFPSVPYFSCCVDVRNVVWSVQMLVEYVPGR